MAALRDGLGSSGDLALKALLDCGILAVMQSMAIDDCFDVDEMSAVCCVFWVVV